MLKYIFYKNEPMCHASQIIASHQTQTAQTATVSTEFTQKASKVETVCDPTTSKSNRNQNPAQPAMNCPFFMNPQRLRQSAIQQHPGQAEANQPMQSANLNPRSQLKCVVIYEQTINMKPTIK